MKKRKHIYVFVFVFYYLTVIFSSALQADTIRVGVLQYGTVHWELDVMQHHKLLQQHGIKLEVFPVASNNAVNVMLQAGNVDLVVGDWIWVSRQRNEGRNFTSFPYSLSEGSLMVHPDANINKIEDIVGLKVGIAGDAVNKNWLITRAYYLHKTGTDLHDVIKPSFAAPPLLNQLMLRGDFDAVLNFWHYSVELEARGMSRLINIDEMLKGLSIDNPIPLLVWVFKDEWAKKNPDLLNHFLNASFETKNILKHSDADWERIKHLTRINDTQTFNILREVYRSGVPSSFGEAEKNAAAKVFQLLGELAGKKLVGNNPVLSDGTFYPDYTIKN